MKDFIAVLKYCRQKEIKLYKDKQYLISNNFKCYRKFSVNFNDESYHFSVACELFEIKFYILKKDQENKGETPYYYSIEEIYKKINSSIYKKIIYKILNGKREKQEKIIFDGSEYNFNFYEVEKFKNKIDTEHIHLLLLLCLIQEKSNLYFGEKSLYCEGIIRLISVLISKKCNHHLLLDRGWIYKDSCFYLEKPSYVNVIILRFSSKERKSRTDFHHMLNCITNKDELIKLFFETYKCCNNIQLSYEECMKQGVFKNYLNNFKNKKLLKVIESLIDCEENYEKSYTKEKQVYIGTNIHYVLRINSSAKYKYYLTKKEKKDIMKG